MQRIVAQNSSIPKSKAMKDFEKQHEYKRNILNK
jgi:hypothetical protein